jgi:hypothetical protein
MGRTVKAIDNQKSTSLYFAFMNGHLVLYKLFLSTDVADQDSWPILCAIYIENSSTTLS